MKKYLLSLFAFSSLFIQAQLFEYLPTDSVSQLRRFSSFDWSYSIQANSLNRGFVQKMIEGGYLDSSFKAETMVALEPRIRAGLMASGGYMFGTKLNDNLGFFVGTQNKFFVNGAVSSDILRLILYGNKTFAGRAARLNGMSLNILDYQKVGGGIYTGAFTNGKRGRFGVGVYYVLGVENIQLAAKTLEFATGPNGYYIDLKANMELKTTVDTSGFKFPAGKGLCADLFYESPFKTDMGEGLIQLGAYDIGRIKWHKNSTIYKVDTSFHFEGIEVDNIFKIDSNSFKDSNRDSLKNKIFTQETKSYSTSLPIELRATILMPVFNKLYVNATMRYFYNANYKIQFLAAANYRALKWLMVDAGVGFGAYGPPTMSFGVTATLKQKTFFRIRATNFEGYFAKSAQAQGLTLTFARLIK